MNFLTEMAAELQQEAAVTRKYLAQVDFQQANFRPHERSESFGRLAIHVAEIVAWWKQVLEEEELNFEGFEPENITTTADLLSYFDQLLAASLEALQQANMETLAQNWSMKHGTMVLFTLSKREVLRKFCFNHLIHHRAQLGMYLRLLDLPVPASYGPSADRRDIELIHPYHRE